MNKTINTKTISIHIALWLTYALITFSWMSSFLPDVSQSIYVTLRIVSLHAIIFYFNVYLLLPKLMERNKYLLYVLSILVLLIAIYFLKEFINEVLSLDANRRGNRAGVARMFRPKRLMSPRFYLDIISSIAVLFVSTTYWVTQQARKRQEKEINLKNENLNNELKLLKSQINPHFLFNALNNIYSLSVAEQKQTPEMIMKLSEMLRYVLYESNETKVSLEKEVDYMNNYIDFQKLKLENTSNIETDFNENNFSIKVEPMLFIPFIENSFKHSNIEQESGFIHIYLTLDLDSNLIFEINNSKPKSEYAKDEMSGIGLENVRKRLELLYPEKYSLWINETEAKYEVKLKLQV